MTVGELKKILSNDVLFDDDQQVEILIDKKQTEEIFKLKALHPGFQYQFWGIQKASPGFTAWIILDKGRL